MDAKRPAVRPEIRSPPGRVTRTVVLRVPRFEISLLFAAHSSSFLRLRLTDDAMVKADTSNSLGAIRVETEFGWTMCSREMYDMER